MRFISSRTIGTRARASRLGRMSGTGVPAVQPWFSPKQAMLESAVIVASILLAFGVDAWWQDRRAASNAQDAIEVVRRDLIDTLEQLEEFEAFSGGTAQASFDVVRALTGPEKVQPDDHAAIELGLIRSSDRRTMRLPRGGYSDLLYTGNLQAVDDRALRDQLVEFYEAADRIQEIVEKNSQLYTDELLRDALLGAGLLVPLATIDNELPQAKRLNLIMAERMGPDFPQRQSRLWQLPENSPEFDRLIAALVQNARGAIIAEVLARETSDNATRLLEQIDRFLASP